MHLSVSTWDCCSQWGWSSWQDESRTNLDTSASRLVQQPRQLWMDKRKCLSETCFQGPSICRVDICVPPPLESTKCFFSHFKKSSQTGCKWLTKPALSYIHAILHQADVNKGQRPVQRGWNTSIPKACSEVLLAFSICYWPHLQMPALRAFQSVEHPCFDLSLVALCRPEEGLFLATWKQLNWCHRKKK